MRKILLLGGSAQQVIAIDTAKKLGYYTVLCDYLSDNPGQYHSDKFYLVSTTDKEAILKVAQEEKVDGILAYASDPAAPTAAYVAEKLELPTNPYISVNTLCNKDKFRVFLKENDFSVPESNSYSSVDEVLNNIKKFNYPIIIKPVDASGSKGITVLENENSFIDAVKFAFSFSRVNKIIIEDYIVKKHPFLIGGDIFILDGKVEIWGLLNCHRDSSANPLVPVGKSYPLCLTGDQINLVKRTLQQLVDKLNIRFGAMNVELVIGTNEKCYLIDAGPRAGGNMIPDLLGMIFDVNVVEMAVQTAMGEKVTCNIDNSPCFYATHNLHSTKNGILNTISFDEEISKYIIKKCIYKKYGDNVEFFNNASKCLGVIFMRFNNTEEMMYILNNIDKYYHIEYLMMN